MLLSTRLSSRCCVNSPLSTRGNCLKYEKSLHKDILASIGSMEIRDYATLVNKCRFIEDCNKKLVVAKLEAYKKRLAP